VIHTAHHGPHWPTGTLARSPRKQAKPNRLGSSRPSRPDEPGIKKHWL